MNFKEMYPFFVSMTYCHYFQAHPLVCLCGGMAAMREKNEKKTQNEPQR